MLLGDNDEPPLKTEKSACVSERRYSVRSRLDALQSSQWSEKVKGGGILDAAGSAINKPGVYLQLLRKNTPEHYGKSTPPAK